MASPQTKGTVLPVKSLNSLSNPKDFIQPTKTPFTITAFPKTDLWRKPAPPALVVTENQPSFVHHVPLKHFLRAKASFNFTATRLYDQGGIVLLFPKGGWVKAGIENTAIGSPKISIVATPPGENGWSDWSVHGSVDPTEGLTMLFERREGSSELEVCVIQNGDKVEVLREVTWVFGNDNVEQVASVGVYAARPDPNDEGPEGLVVSFDYISVEVTEGSKT